MWLWKPITEIGERKGACLENTGISNTDDPWTTQWLGMPNLRAVKNLSITLQPALCIHSYASTDSTNCICWKLIHVWANLHSSNASCSRVNCIFYLFVCLFIYFWLHRVFVAARGRSLVVASRGHSSLWCAGFSLQWLLLLQSMGSRHAGFSSCGTRAQ